MAISDNEFDSSVVSLDNPNIGVPLGSLSGNVGQAEKEAVAKSLTPDVVDPSAANIINEQEQAEISVDLDALPLSGFDKTSATPDDPTSLAGMLKSKINPFSMFESIQSTVDASSDPLTLALGETGSMDLSGTKTDAIDEAMEEELFGGDPYVPDSGLGTLASEGYDYAKGKGSALYQSYFGDPYAGQNTITTSTPYGPSPVGGAAAFGSGVNLATYATPFSTSLAGQAGRIFNSAGSNFASQASIGLSSAPPASLAGQGAGNVAASSGRSIFGSAASIYGIYDGIKNKDYFSAGTSLITLINPATAVPMAILMGAKMLLGAWSASKRPKPNFGGAEFKATKNGLEATGGWGYNGYKKEAGQATVASVADYVNSYTKAFGLNFNGNRWADAIANDPKMNRYDSTDESGYRDPTILTRKIFETKGLITGNPTYNGQAITSQEDYKKKMEEFNAYYKKTALENGGLVDAKRAGITQDLSNEYKQITFKNSTQVGGGGTGKNYQTKVTGGYGTQATTETGYYEPGVGRQPGRWVPAASNVVLESAGYNSGTGAYAINYNYEDATPFDMVYRNLVGRFQRGQGGTNY